MRPDRSRTDRTRIFVSSRGQAVGHPVGRRVSRRQDAPRTDYSLMASGVGLHTRQPYLTHSCQPLEVFRHS